MSKCQCSVVNSQCLFANKSTTLKCSANKCCELYTPTFKQKLVCREEGKKFTLKVLEGKFYKVKLDGCVDNDSSDKKCDFMVFDDKKSVEIFVELKGTKLMRAQEQIEKSIERYSLVQKTKKIACIVCSRVPKGTNHQKIIDDFARKRVKCKIISNRYICYFDANELALKECNE